MSPDRFIADAAMLDRLAAAYRRRRLWSMLALAVASGLLVAVVYRMAGTGRTVAVPAGLATALVSIGAAVLLARRNPVTGLTVAQHFNRTIPAVEESADLLLTRADDLPLLDALERRRVASVLSREPPPALPDRRARELFSAAGALTVLAIVVAVAPTRHPTAGTGAARRARAPSAAPAIDRARITIAAPSYTGTATREQSDWDIETVAGARVSWYISTNATAGRIVTSAGDTIRLTADTPGSRASSDLPHALTGTLRADHAVLYQVVLERSGLRSVSDFHRLSAAADAAPSVVIIAPRERTELAPGGELRVGVEVAAGDDYGVGSARLVATLTSGEGEAVKFREQIFPLSNAGARGGPAHTITLRTTLDLGALGLQPGDELYFHAEATDRRVPAPNVGRSETVFLSITDTARVALAGLTGMAIRLAPEYFRSQRQIIIDTERLIADRPRIALQAFRDRSNNIGMDQGLLRGRYGELVGDETETGSEGTEVHQHDMAENATLLAASVKAKLKAALAEMWEAELRLRTYRPAEALPFEYRALNALKEMQQDARLYVQRTGIEPTPLDPARTRLSGKLDAIASHVARDSAADAVLLPAVRSAIAALQSARGNSLDATALAALSAAETELAPLAAGDARHLETLRAVRVLKDRARARRVCSGCVDRVIRGLWLALPAAPIRPRAERTSAGAGALARRYFERTGRVERGAGVTGGR